MRTALHASRTAIHLMLAAVSLSFLAFCILSSSSGNPRKYPDSDIPFVYRVHVSTPPEFISGIDQGAQVWEDVLSSYWQFEAGPPTTESGAGQDGINLVFFDFDGVNFEPGTSVIAFSRTFTTGSGASFRAVESDLIWNALGFPPSPTGAGGQQDLIGVVAHEFGHHLGMGHAGLPSGSNSGCGPEIPDATMWAFGSPGDTTARSLHLDDIAGVSYLYPVWKITGMVKDASTGDPLEDAEVQVIGSALVSPGGVTTAGSSFGLPADLSTGLVTGPAGTYSGVIVDQNPIMTFEKFGFSPESLSVSFATPVGIGLTQTIVVNPDLQPAPLATLQGTVRDSVTGNPIVATLQFWGVGDFLGSPRGSVTTEPDGSYSVMLPSDEAYDIIVSPELPYPDQIFVENVALPSGGLVFDFDLNPASVLIVDDDAGESFETFYNESLDSLNIPRHMWSVTDEGGTPTIEQLSLFSAPQSLVWYTGNDTANALTAEERLLLIDHLESGGTLLLSGQNIAEFSDPEDSLLSRYLGVTFETNFPFPFVEGFPDDIIGDGLTVSVIGGAANQTSKDQLSLSPNPIGTVFKSFYYRVTAADTDRIAGVRIDHGGSIGRAVFFGFGLEGVGNLSQRNSVVDRSLRWLADTTTVTSVKPVMLSSVPSEFHLQQNYPNPFNPSTVIAFDIPKDSRVTLKLYDLLGREVMTLADKSFTAGSYRMKADLSSLGSGIYFYRLNAGTFTSTKKMLLLK